MTGAVIGVVVSVVAIAAWLGGRFAGAVLPRKSDEGSITCAETVQKVIGPDATPQKLSEKVIGAGPADREGNGGAAAERPAPANEPAPAEHAATPIATARILVGARPDAGTTLRLDAPVGGWPDHVQQIRDREIGRAFSVAGKTVELERRGHDGDVLVLRARGQARLLIWDDRAELVVGSRALDTLGGIVGWAREWLTWASTWLLGATLDRERPLEAADELGWIPIAVDLATDLAGWGPLLDEHQDPDRWTQQTVPLPVPAGRGQLASIQLGEKSSNPLSVYGYDKTRWAARTGRGVAWLERMRQAGRLPDEAVWRWELRLRGEALQLRKRGRGEIVVDFRRCATLADQPAIARAWAYGFGNAESDRPNGHYRLTVPAERFDEQGRGVPLTRTRAVDPLWRVVQAAGGQAPIETLAQVRERKEAARADWRSKAEDLLLRGLAAAVALDHPDDAQGAADAALERARELVTGERWIRAHELQVAATHDLRDTDDDESPPNPPKPEPEPKLEPNEEADMTPVDKRKFVGNTATGTLMLDTRYFPVLIATWMGEMSPELVDRYFDLRNPITRHAHAIEAKVFVITDITAMDLPTATQRKYVARCTAESDPKFGYALVAPNTILRGIVTAVRWVLGESGAPARRVGSLEAAFTLTRSVYRDAGFECPPTDRRSRPDERQPVLHPARTRVRARARQRDRPRVDPPPR